MLLVAGLLWALSAKDGPLELSERTDLMALACGVVTVVGMFATFWRPRGAGEDATAAVAKLTQAVREVGEPQWRQSLGGDLTAIDVTFRFRPQAGARAAVLPAAPALQLARVVLWNRRRLPLRLARFLDWCVTAGLMRTSGVAYQFRHREFQEWLVRNPAP